MMPHPQSVRVTFRGPGLDEWLGELPRAHLSPPTGFALSSPPSRTTAQSSSFLAPWLGAHVHPGRSSPPGSFLSAGGILNSAWEGGLTGQPEGGVWFYAQACPSRAAFRQGRSLGGATLPRGVPAPEASSTNLQNTGNPICPLSHPDLGCWLAA